jgi:hypothetical protein
MPIAPSTQVSVINASTLLTDDDVRPVVNALQQQVTNDLYPAWGKDAELTFIPSGSFPIPMTWWLVILDDPGEAAAVGYHDTTDEGQPLGKVFAGTDIQLGKRWTVTASHELLEMLVDPDVNLTVFVQRNNEQSVIYACELCDACEEDRSGYVIDGVVVSDFVYPAWFQSFRTTGSARFDHANQIQNPFQLLSGYIGVYDLTSLAGWQQITVGGDRQMRYDQLPPVGSRRERRRRPRDLWLPSARQKERAARFQEMLKTQRSTRRSSSA